jgi:GNAT superfamily N-acetyltransferase
VAELFFDPPLLPADAFALGRGFSQSIKLTRSGKTIGAARWYCSSLGDGVCQLLEIHVESNIRRKGHARRLLDATLDQARQLHQLHNARLRRFWAVARQKQDIAARAFLTSNSFHHIGSMDDFFDSEEVMVYVRTFD